MHRKHKVLEYVTEHRVTRQDMIYTDFEENPGRHKREGDNALHTQRATGNHTMGTIHGGGPTASKGGQ